MKGFGGMGQMGQMMKQAQMMQMNIQKAQKELETIEVTGEAGNGMVKVTMTCKNVCRRVMIDDMPCRCRADREMLEDLLLTAINDAFQEGRSRNQCQDQQGNRWYETPVLIQWNKSEQLPN